ncbi:hypothetical protein ACWCYY_34620 [Kitasatospora sp. NPDC001664]
MTDDDTMPYRPVNSLAGMLQRGHGSGARSALGHPDHAAPLVLDMIRRDWRWDSTDDRALYLARLVRDLALPRGPIAALLGEDDQQTERACEVLELLALDGDGEAREALRSYVRAGAHWVPVLESLAGRWPVTWWEEFGEVARERIGAHPDPLWMTEPWARFGIPTERCAARPAAPDLSGPADGELLALLATGAGDRTASLRELARRAPTEELLPLVPSPATPDGRRPLPLLRRAVDRLGPAAVPAARRWVGDERPWLARLGADVLADHLGPEVIPHLVAQLAEQRAARAWCGPDLTARRLARFGPEAAGAAADLRWFWLRTPHSYERAAYLEALAAIVPAGLQQGYLLSLWDCEEASRLLGVARAPDGPEVAARLAELRDDPMEEPEVRASARARLATP